MTEASAVPIAAAKSDAARARTQDCWLFVDGASAFGGHEVMLLRWLEELQAQRSVTAVVLAREGSQLARDAASLAAVLTLPRFRAGLPGRIAKEVRDVLRFVRVAMRIRPQLCVVAEGCLLSQPVFALLARVLGLRVVEYVPLLQTSTSMGFASGPLRDAFVRHVYAKALHGWITITQQQAEDFRAWSGVRRPILTLPNTVMRAIEAEAATPSRALKPDGPIRVLVLGRIEAHQKGLDTLLEYLVANPALATRMRVRFVGAGPFEATIARQLSHDTALARWVELRPWTAPLQALREHDVLLMTSRYEGVPLVMLEAMACGVPVVAPDLPGTCAFLDDDGLFAVGQMAEAFDKVARLADPQTYRAVVQRNRQVFADRASNAAFSAAVRALTPQLRALGHARRRSA